MEFTASSIMRAKLVKCNSTSTLKEVTKKMLDEKVGSVLIQQKGKSVGIIIDRDILHAAVDGKDFTSTQAAEIMSSPLDCCNADDSLEKCKELFEKTNHSRLVVRKGEKVVGVLLRKFVDRFSGISRRYSLANIARTPRFRTGRG